MRLRPLPVLAALGLALVACGGSKPDRFNLRTPGANTGEAAVVPAPESPTPTPTPTATPTPKPPGGAVTGEERRIIRGWSDALRHGHVAKASKYFSIPSVVQNGGSGGALSSFSNVEQFNRTLPCGARLVKTNRGTKAHWVVGTFVLTERPGGACGSGAGARAYVAFMIARHHITEWIQIDASQATAPAPTPTPDPSTTSSTAA